MLNFLGRKSCILGLLFLCSGLAASAQNSVKMIESNGKETIFQLAENPKVSISDKNLLIETSNDKVTCAIGEGVRFQFLLADAGVGEVSADNTPVFKISQVAVEASGITASSPVTVYDMAGKIVKATQSDSNGCATVNISDLPAGVYIFKTIDKNFKFYKK